MARAYMEAVWNCEDRCGAAGSVLGTFGDGTVVGIGDGSTLGDVAVVVIGDGTTLGDGAVVGIYDAPLGDDVVGARVGRYVSNIPCRFLCPAFVHPPLRAGVLVLDCRSPPPGPLLIGAPHQWTKVLGLGSYAGKIQLS